MPRPRTPLLSQDRIRDVALELIDDHGLSALSMRRLAGALGVQAASLYTHYATKDDVLDAVANKLIAEVDTSGFEQGWRQGLLTWARSYHAALTAHPNAAPIIRASSRLESPDSYVRAEWPGTARRAEPSAACRDC